jgi:exportin-1
LTKLKANLGAWYENKSLLLISHFNLIFQEYTGEDDSDLYLEERLMALRQAQELKRRVQLSVPGILNPHELPEEMQD